MNERIIKIAYALAVGILLLIAVVLAAGQGQDTIQQTRSSKQSSGQHALDAKQHEPRIFVPTRTDSISLS
jgi:hypothetical protein